MVKINLAQEVVLPKGFKHGACVDGKITKEYSAWKAIIQRCHNPRHFAFPKYGAVGIYVCSQWRESFAAFFKDMGRAPSDFHSVERKDPNKGYEPGNCKWGTSKEQANNKKTSRFVFYKGERLTVAQAAERFGFYYTLLYQRLQRFNWDLEKAISEPRITRGSKPNRKFPQSEYSSVEFYTWHGIRTRCNDPNCPAYPKYGGRGIRVCERWDEYANFLADMGRRPSPYLSIERKDYNGNYEPGNCYWGTRPEQGTNRSGIPLVEFNGKSMTMSQWAVELGIKRRTLAKRALVWVGPLRRLLLHRLGNRRIELSLEERH